MKFNLIRQYNKYASQNKNMIAKALDSSNGVGEALIPQHLEKVITNTMVRLSPELAMINPVYGAQKYHEFNRLIELPSAGGSMGENAVTPVKNSKYVRDGVNLKIKRRKGAVTNFQQDASQDYIDSAAAEMENHLQSHAYDLATEILWGNELADSYCFGGLDRFIKTNRNVGTLGGTVPTNLGFLDDMIDVNADLQGAPHRKAFVMSNKMLSFISRLMTNVRISQGIVGQGLTQVEIPGGWRLNAYRDIPIITTNAVRPKAQMGTVTLSKATTGGSLPQSTAYHVKVAPITYNGEELASVDATITTDAGTSTNKITATWSAFTGALYYKVFFGTTEAGLKLIKVISAFTYDENGTPTGNVTTTDILATAPEASVPTHMQNDVPLVATGGVAPERIILWDLDDFQGMGKLPYTNSGGSKFNGLVTIEPLAKTDDFLPFLIKTYGALCPAFEATSVIQNNIRVA